MNEPRIKEAPVELEAWWYHCNERHEDQKAIVQTATSLTMLKTAAALVAAEFALALLIYAFRHQLYALWRIL